MISSKDIDANGLTRAQAEEIESKVKDAFGRRLYAAILKKGITQAETARRAGIGRYNVNNYLQGRALPTPLTLQKLAEALDMKPSDLMPENAFEQAAAEKTPPKDVYSISSLAGGKARVQLDKVVRMSTALKIGQLIDDEAGSSD
ncbi:hypothetical protein XM25_00835 [Devosia sp. H5989]|nr:hypothetical protein XM25_00835 [Devosia sp. H5989]